MFKNGKLLRRGCSPSEHEHTAGQYHTRGRISFLENVTALYTTGETVELGTSSLQEGFFGGSNSALIAPC
jgi:hypothetical protein